MKTTTENITRAGVWSMRTEFNLRHYVQFYCFRTFYCGQSKLHQNASADAT